jgi:diadenosine tetraphosphate (Ap4A) HIT family hydrolase
MERIWDPENKYEAAFLAEYQYWVLEVNFRQHTLGCYIILAKRHIEKITELTDGEMLELKQIMAKIENALLSAPEFRPDRFNYLQLGNGKHLLHIHGVPRYLSSRSFKGKEWVDANPKLPAIWDLKDAPKDVIIAIKKTLEPYL